MILFNWKITKNFALDISCFYFCRHIKDGIDWISFEIDSSWFEGDHNPQFSIIFIILNFIIFEFNIYNKHHLVIKN
jgi:hypothetical protein